MPTKPSILLPSAGRLVEFGDRAVAGPLVFLGDAEVESLVADRHPVLAEEDAEHAVEVAGDLGKERRHVRGPERNSGRLYHLAARLLDLLRVSVARGLPPRIVRVGDMPSLAQLIDEVGRKGHGLRWGVVEWPETVAVALGRRECRVEAYADDVDDLVLLENRHAGQADVGEEAAQVDVDLVLDQELLGLAAADVGLELIVRHDQLDRPAVDAAGLVDAVDRHLHSHQRGLAAGRTGARERLQRADLVGLGLAEGGLPRRRHQHSRPQGAGACRAISDQAAAGDLAAVPEFLAPVLRFLLVSHLRIPLCSETDPLCCRVLACS